MSWDVCGHEWAERLLQGHITRQEVRHAYLFTGPSGVGRRTLALRFAKALNCLHPPAPGEFCNACRICRQLEAMQHSDLTILQAETEGGTLKVEQVRDAQRSLSLMPYDARYRIALLLRFQEANASAQNALLKTLEEAPRQVILLLTADSPESLLPTIVSRCEVLRLRPLPLERLQNELVKREVEAESARFLSHLAGGRLGYALRLKDSPDLLQQRSAYIEEMLKVMGENLRGRIEFVDSIYREREELRSRLNVWLSLWRDVMLRAASPTLPLENIELDEMITTLAQQVDLAAAHARVTDLEQGISRLDANANARLLAEVILFDWPRITLIEGDTDV